MTGGVDLNGKVIGGNVPGRESFIQWAKEKFVKDLPAGDYSGYKGLKRYKAQEQISRLLEAEFGLTLNQISNTKGDMRRMAMELLYRAGGMTGLEIGGLFGISPGAVSRERKRLTARMAEDGLIKTNFENLYGQCM